MDRTHTLHLLTRNLALFPHVPLGCLSRSSLLRTASSASTQTIPIFPLPVHVPPPRVMALHCQLPTQDNFLLLADGTRMSLKVATCPAQAKAPHATSANPVLCSPSSTPHQHS